MTEALECHPSATAYTPRRLALYDAVILGLSCSLVWKCPRRYMLELYNRHVGAPHLDIGVGTGYFLDNCQFPVAEPEITLIDLSEACLSKADGGVVFGSTILGSGVDHGWVARKALRLYNREGVFTNAADSLDGLERTLAAEVGEPHIEVRGSFALFDARA